jgi:hypothetical protein
MLDKKIEIKEENNKLIEVGKELFTKEKKIIDNDE